MSEPNLRKRKNHLSKKNAAEPGKAVRSLFLVYNIAITQRVLYIDWPTCEDNKLFAHNLCDLSAGSFCVDLSSKDSVICILKMRVLTCGSVP